MCTTSVLVHTPQIPYPADILPPPILYPSDTLPPRHPTPWIPYRADALPPPPPSYPTSTGYPIPLDTVPLRKHMGPKIPPGERRLLRRWVHILLECFLVITTFIAWAEHICSYTHIAFIRSDQLFQNTCSSQESVRRVYLLTLSCVTSVTLFLLWEVAPSGEPRWNSSCTFIVRVASFS